MFLLMIARPVIKQNEFTQQWQCDVLLTSEEKRCLLIKIGAVKFFSIVDSGSLETTDTNLESHIYLYDFVTILGSI